MYLYSRTLLYTIKRIKYLNVICLEKKVLFIFSINRPCSMANDKNVLTDLIIAAFSYSLTQARATCHFINSSLYHTRDEKSLISSFVLSPYILFYFIRVLKIF